MLPGLLADRQRGDCWSFTETRRTAAGRPARRIAGNRALTATLIRIAARVPGGGDRAPLSPPPRRQRASPGRRQDSRKGPGTANAAAASPAFQQVPALSPPRGRGGLPAPAPGRGGPAPG